MENKIAIQEIYVRVPNTSPDSRRFNRVTRFMRLENPKTREVIHLDDIFAWKIPSDIFIHKSYNSLMEKPELLKERGVILAKRTKKDSLHDCDCYTLLAESFEVLKEYLLKPDELGFPKVSQAEGDNCETLKINLSGAKLRVEIYRPITSKVLSDKLIKLILRQNWLAKLAPRQDLSGLQYLINELIAVQEAVSEVRIRAKSISFFNFTGIMLARLDIYSHQLNLLFDDEIYPEFNKMLLDVWKSQEKDKADFMSIGPKGEIKYV